MAAVLSIVSSRFVQSGFVSVCWDHRSALGQSLTCCQRAVAAAATVGVDLPCGS
jgi:hypothetical protein